MEWRREEGERRWEGKAGREEGKGSRGEKGRGRREGKREGKKGREEGKGRREGKKGGEEGKMGGIVDGCLYNKSITRKAFNLLYKRDGRTHPLSKKKRVTTNGRPAFS